MIYSQAGLFVDKVNGWNNPLWTQLADSITAEDLIQTLDRKMVALNFFPDLKFVLTSRPDHKLLERIKVKNERTVGDSPFKANSDLLAFRLACPLKDIAANVREIVDTTFHNMGIAIIRNEIVEYGLFNSTVQNSRCRIHHRISNRISLHSLHLQD